MFYLEEHIINHKIAKAAYKIVIKHENSLRGRLRMLMIKIITGKIRTTNTTLEDSLKSIYILFNLPFLKIFFAVMSQNKESTIPEKTEIQNNNLLLVK
jgi:hypothetical protein